MTQHITPLSLWSAIIININIMLGVGIFINTTELAKRAGALGLVSYLIIGVLMLPLILAITQLLERYPSGGFYVFGSRAIGTFAGFVSAWIYFVAKLASASLMIHTAVTLLQKIMPGALPLPTLALDFILIGLFCFLNTRNMKTGSSIQGAFVFFKMMPIAFAACASYLFFNRTFFAPENCLWEGIPSTLPLVLYATVGFEAACSLSSRIKNARRNAPLAVLISYTIVIAITALYQGMLFGTLGTSLMGMKDYTEPFPKLLGLWFTQSPHAAHVLASLLHIGIALSALGGAYGILFSNSWNLYTLAEHNHIPGKKLFIANNNQGIPWRCIVIEGLLCIMYLLVTQGHQTTLQQISALGCILTYTISVCALLKAQWTDKVPWYSYIISVLALINCCMLSTSCIYSLYTNSTYALFMFSGLLCVGYALYAYTKKMSSEALT